MPHRLAIRLLEPFRVRVLPGLLRKLLLWKGLDPTRHVDLIEDLSQELFLDCIQHGPEIIALPERERHTRWLRLLERCVYWQYTRADRQRDHETTIDNVGIEGESPSHSDSDLIEASGLDLPLAHQQFLRQLQGGASYLKNGRINSRRSARALGLRDGTFKHAWGEIAAGLGFDDEFLEFWRGRLVEALVGLAADLLRDTQAVHVHDEPRRRRPDPAGRIRRIRRLRDALSSHPVPSDIKTVLSHYRRGSLHRSPLLILSDAASLRPDSAAVQLWMFEAALSVGDLGIAARALRAAQNTDAERVRVLLARARLLQVRGRCAAARWLLDHHPQDDPRLLAARRALALVV